MCGIAGFLSTNNTSDFSTVIHKMTDKIAHRGPNAEGFFINENIALGHRRLSIIDLSTSANQPFVDGSGRYVIVFNGEIYNYKEVKKSIKEYNFITEGDTEVILAAYIKWGEACLNQLNGMFAFAIWDNEGKKLFMARDRMGVKPFYYFNDENTFAFSSEIRSLLAGDFIDRKLNKNAVQDFLTYSTINAPETIIDNIFQLMPGEYANYQEGTFEKKYYWKLEGAISKNIPEDYGSIKKEVKNLLRASVERRLVADVPLGAFLSGGIDSSVVVGLMAEICEGAVNTFSIIFDEPQFDESKYSGIISRKFNTRHTPILLRPDDFLKELPNALQAMDTPSGDGINTYLVSKVTRGAGITVALSGLGGDELFAGYPVFAQFKNLNNYKWAWSMPKYIRRLIGDALENYLNDNRGGRINELISAGQFNIANIYPVMRKLMVDSQVKAFFNQGKIGPNSIQKILNDRLSVIQSLPLFSQVSVGELLSYTLNTLLKDTDQMSMASALEIREPFFDYKLVEFVMAVPDRYKPYPKTLLVDSMGDLLPPEIVNRPKMGFVFPWKEWMKNELKSFCHDRIYRLAARGILDPEHTKKLWVDFLKGDKKSFMELCMAIGGIGILAGRK